MNFPFVVAEGASLDSGVGAAINERYLAPETEVVRSLADLARLPPERRDQVRPLLARVFEPALAADGVRMMARTFVVTARRG